MHPSTSTRLCTRSLLVPGTQAQEEEGPVSSGVCDPGEKRQAPMDLHTWGLPSVPTRGPHLGDRSQEDVQGRLRDGKAGAAAGSSGQDPGARSGLVSSGRTAGWVGGWVGGWWGVWPHTFGRLGAPIADTLPLVKRPVRLRQRRKPRSVLAPKASRSRCSPKRPHPIRRLDSLLRVVGTQRTFRPRRTLRVPWCGRDNTSP